MKISVSSDQRKAIESTTHTAVRANAGSGKTMVLTLKYLWHVVNDGVDVDRIVAITFTTKAAAEMTSRIHDLVETLLHDEIARNSIGFHLDDSTVIARLNLLRTQLTQLRISTFHAFCNGLLRRFGHLANIDPESREIATIEGSMLMREAIRSQLRKHLADETYARELLRAFETLDIYNVELSIESMMQGMEHEGDALHWIDALNEKELSDERRRRAADLIKPFLTSFLDQTLAQLRSDAVANSKESQEWTAKLNSHLSAVQQTEVSAGRLAESITDLLAIYTKEGTPRKTKKPFADVERLSPLSIGWEGRLSNSIADNEPLELQQASILRVLRTVALAARTEYTREKRLRGGIDYADMINGAIELLKRNQKITSAIQRSIAYLLVDEFQDTDSSQLELITLLVPDLTNRAEQQSAKVFIVGDPKQSIYAFRGADVRSFHRAEQLIKDANTSKGLPEGAITLHESYRMAPQLQRSVDTACKHVFELPIPLSEFDVDYDDLIAGRTSEFGSQIGSLQLICSKDLPGSIARHICDILNNEVEINVEAKENGQSFLRTATLSDIGVICRTRALAASITTELRKLNVPVQLFGGREFYSRPEVRDVRNLLEWLSDSSGSLHLAALLRSPLFRITDNELVQIAATGGKLGFSQASFETYASSPSASTDLIKARDVLKQLSDLSKTLPPHQVVRIALLKSEWHATIANDVRREQILSNIEKVLAIIADVASLPGSTLRDVVDAIQIPDEDKEAEGRFVVDDNAVQIMTIHSAKGLEFPVVFLVDPTNSGGGKGAAFRKSDSIGPSFLDGTLTHTANQLNNDCIAEAEWKRFFYVGLTRARDHLFVCSDVGKQPSSLSQYNVVEVSNRDAVFVGTNAENSQIDVSAFSPSYQLDFVSVSELVSVQLGEPIESGNSRFNAALFGIVFHEAIAMILDGSVLNIDEAIAASLQTHDSDSLSRELLFDQIKNSVERSGLRDGTAPLNIEIAYTNVLEGTIVDGRIDLNYRQGNVEYVWDWKTSAVASHAEALEIAKHYELQGMAYAWLRFADEAVETVHVTFAFAALAGSNGEWTVVESYDRRQISTIETALKVRFDQLITSQQQMAQLN